MSSDKDRPQGRREVGFARGGGVCNGLNLPKKDVVTGCGH